MPQATPPSQPNLIGQSLSRIDAPAKAAGREKYASDFFAPDMLWAGVKRAGIPHGRIVSTDTKAAKGMAGVAAVLTHQDVKGPNRQGVALRDQPVLANDKVRHCGDPVVLVVAETRAALGQALNVVRIEYEELPGVFYLDAALAEGAPIIHEDHPTGNLLLEGRVERGLGAAALQDCPVVIEAEFHMPRQEHAYLETEAGWGRLEDDGTLFISASTQTPFRDRSEVAEALGLDPDKVRVHAPYPGGAFGGKDGVTVQSLLGLAALACPGRPVKIHPSREDSFLASTKRHPARLRYRLGADFSGRLLALEATLDYDTGPYDHLGGVVMALGLEHAGGPYAIDNVSLHGRAIYTNNPVGGAFRGFGVPQAAAALEQVMDMLARRLGLDPFELRARNLAVPDGPIASGAVPQGPCGLGQCLAELQKHPLWRDREAFKARAGRFKLRGVGLAAVLHGMGYGPVVPDVANAKLELTSEGRFAVACGVVDMGQGNNTTYLQLAGQALDQPLERLDAVLPDTSRTLPSGSSSASRTTYTYGRALLMAADILKERILGRAADLFMVPESEMALAPGVVQHTPTGRDFSLADLAKRMAPEERVAVARWRAPVSDQQPCDDPMVRMHGLPHCIFSYGAVLAGVEVDELTGQVELKSLVAAYDCGDLLNPRLILQQMQGAAAQGAGMALWEDFASREGRILTPDLATYLIPTALDLPDAEFSFAPTHEPSGPHGLKGAGEVGVDGIAPAVGNALADACGMRLHRLPLTPERVLAALAGREGAAS